MLLLPHVAGGLSSRDWATNPRSSFRPSVSATVARGDPKDDPDRESIADDIGWRHQFRVCREVGEEGSAHTAVTVDRVTAAEADIRKYDGLMVPGEPDFGGSARLRCAYG